MMTFPVSNGRRPKNVVSEVSMTGRNRTTPARSTGFPQVVAGIAVTLIHIVDQHQAVVDGNAGQCHQAQHAQHREVVTPSANGR